MDAPQGERSSKTNLENQANDIGDATVSTSQRSTHFQESAPELRSQSAILEEVMLLRAIVMEIKERPLLDTALAGGVDNRTIDIADSPPEYEARDARI
jgi:hypothetical protein